MSRRLADVAAKVGVSEASVSRVLNGKPGVSDATRAAVLTALDVLGYERPTKLRGNRAPLVGLVLPELQNPIFPALADVIGGALAQRGFTSLLCTLTAGGVTESDYIDLLLQQQVSGVIFAGGLYAQAAAPHQHYLTLRERRLPTVLLNASIDDLGFPRISCDDHVATELALGHLLSLGHTRIGFLLGPADHVPSQRKLERARTMMADAGLDLPDEQIVHSAYSLEAGQSASKRLLAAGVTGIICASDPLALGAVRAIRRAGSTVPGDVSVIGFDDSSLMSCTEPPLTTVRQPIELMGRAAIDTLVRAIQGETVDPEELLFEPELVVRASTGPAPA
ncbi:LacI family DNA-binding transcriptional regulator [Occultella kanbiaonis]|uniref:LacI family DNA-binding transcriptional regulator n=1 Tax=Occultella kanbiaonis TaxID=2675754 RepID=UPI0013D215BD|nr:LacI family DNA-binding transcriptional regulator [Occultella kanbiaonis]